MIFFKKVLIGSLVVAAGLDIIHKALQEKTSPFKWYLNIHNDDMEKMMNGGFVRFYHRDEPFIVKRENL